jgi:hypothetical protein
MGGVARGDRARQLDGLELDRLEARRTQILLDQAGVRVTEGPAFHVARISGKEARHCLARRSRNRIQVEAVERHHHVAAAGPEHTVCLGVRPHLVGKEHDSEKAENQIEARLLEREILRVGLLEGDPLGAHLPRRELDHGRVDVRRDDRGVR